MPFDLPPSSVIVWCSVMGLFVGSFLNVAIHRYGIEGETVSKPRRSRCPSCRTELTWSENLPLLSWIVQRGRCRTCSWPIPWRYPLVEALNAGLWFLVAIATPPDQWGLLAIRLLAVSALVVTTFVDFDHREIPDGVSKGGMYLAPFLSFAVPALHQNSWVAQRLSEGFLHGAEVTRIGAVTASFAGMAVGGGILWSIGWLGSKAFKREAMGFGDVKLLAAAGGFIGAAGALVALVLASVAGSIFGIANIVRFYCITRRRSVARGRRPEHKRCMRVAHYCGSMLPFGPYLALGIGIGMLYWNDVIQLWRAMQLG